MKIKLYNRDGANLWLEEVDEISPTISTWKLRVDNNHKYCLEYIRVIGNYPDNIEAIDPSGGPMISVGDKLKDKYEIVKIINSTTFWISEGTND